MLPPDFSPVRSTRAVRLSSFAILTVAFITIIILCSSWNWHGTDSGCGGKCNAAASARLGRFVWHKLLHKIRLHRTWDDPVVVLQGYGARTHRKCSAAREQFWLHQPTNNSLGSTRACPLHQSLGRRDAPTPAEKICRPGVSLPPSTGLGSWVLGLPGRLGLGSWSQPEDWVLGLGSWGRRRPDFLGSETLESEKLPFFSFRFCVFPKNYQADLIFSAILVRIGVGQRCWFGGESPIFRLQH